MYNMDMAEDMAEIRQKIVENKEKLTSFRRSL